jgi:hypothetical protein
MLTGHYSNTRLGTTVFPKAWNGHAVGTVENAAKTGPIPALRLILAEIA